MLVANRQRACDLVVELELGLVFAGLGLRLGFPSGLGFGFGLLGLRFARAAPGPFCTTLAVVRFARAAPRATRAVAFLVLAGGGLAAAGTFGPRILAAGTSGTRILATTFGT